MPLQLTDTLGTEAVVQSNTVSQDDGTCTVDVLAYFRDAPGRQELRLAFTPDDALLVAAKLVHSAAVAKWQNEATAAMRVSGLKRYAPQVLLPPGPCSADDRLAMLRGLIGPLTDVAGKRVQA